mmetsp:Transcript_12878/g.25177  ORF Transcript_12878/g.25177 Transcript_12878/m.25177 type:complete len:215 (+) Transcript_12878:281-925(+)
MRLLLSLSFSFSSSCTKGVHSSRRPSVALSVASRAAAAEATGPRLLHLVLLARTLDKGRLVLALVLPVHHPRVHTTHLHHPLVLQVWHMVLGPAALERILGRRTPRPPRGVGGRGHLSRVADPHGIVHLRGARAGAAHAPHVLPCPHPVRPHLQIARGGGALSAVGRQVDLLLLLALTPVLVLVRRHVLAELVELLLVNASRNQLLVEENLKVE